MERSVNELTTAIASGDPDAFAAFFREYFEHMFRDAKRLTGRDESFCLDVVQDAMVRVVRSLKPMSTEEHLRRWLRAVVGACAFDRLRAESRRTRREHAADLSKARGAEDESERLDWLRRELAQMDTPRAGLLTLRFRLGWTLQRIGSALGLSAGAVDGRISRALSDLRDKAREEFDDRTT